MSEKHVVIALPSEGGGELVTVERIAENERLGATSVSAVAFTEDGFEWVLRPGDVDWVGSPNSYTGSDDSQFHLAMGILNHLEALTVESGRGSELQILVRGNDRVAQALEFALQDEPSALIDTQPAKVPSAASRTEGFAGPSGPERPTFRWEKPAHYVTFNSIIDNPAVGDEREFIRAKAFDDKHGDFEGWVSLAPGRRYVFQVDYHNDLSTSFSQESLDARLTIELPRTVPAQSEDSALTASISARNAHPREVFSSVRLYNDTLQDIEIRYLPGSARLSTGYLDNVTLDDEVSSPSGALLGGSKLDGAISGDVRESGRVTFECET